MALVNLSQSHSWGLHPPSRFAAEWTLWILWTYWTGLRSRCPHLALAHRCWVRCLPVCSRKYSMQAHSTQERPLPRNCLADCPPVLLLPAQSAAVQLSLDYPSAGWGRWSSGLE